MSKTLPRQLSPSQPLTDAYLWRRQQVAAALRKCAWSHHDKAGQAALLALAEGRSLLITGQQAGLALGPALLLWKVLAVVAAADRVERESGTRPVTVVWIEGNDHDWAEAAAAGWPLKGFLPPPLDAQARSVGRMVPDPAWWQQARLGLEGLGLAAESALAIELASACTGTLCEHSARLLHALLPTSGLLCLDPSLPELRELAHPFLCDLHGRNPELQACIQADTDTLRQQGLPTPVAVDARPLLFSEGDRGERLRLEPGASCPGAQSASPSALGRVLLQDWLLGPLASWLGPTERAYHRQVESAARLLGLTEVLRLPRPHVQLARVDDLRLWRELGANPWLPPRPGLPWPEDVLATLPGGGELRQAQTQLRDLAAAWQKLCQSRDGAFPQLAARHEALASQLQQALIDQHKSRHKAQLKAWHALAHWQDGELPQERRVNALALLDHMGGPALLDTLRTQIDPLDPGPQHFSCAPDGHVERVV